MLLPSPPSTLPNVRPAFVEFPPTTAADTFTSVSQCPAATSPNVKHASGCACICTCDQLCPKHQVSIALLCETPAELSDDENASVLTYVSSNDEAKARILSPPLIAGSPTRVSSPVLMRGRPSSSSDDDATIASRSPSPGMRAATAAAVAAHLAAEEAAGHPLEPGTYNIVLQLPDDGEDSGEALRATGHVAPNELTMHDAMPEKLRQTAGYVFIMTKGIDRKLGTQPYCGMFPTASAPHGFCNGVSGGFYSRLHNASEAWVAWVDGFINQTLHFPVHPDSLVGPVVTDDEVMRRAAIAAVATVAAGAPTAKASNTAADAAPTAKASNTAVDAAPAPTAATSAAPNAAASPPVAKPKRVSVPAVGAQAGDSVAGGIELLSIRRSTPPLEPPREFVYLIVKGTKTGKYFTRKAYDENIGNHPEALGFKFKREATCDTFALKCLTSFQSLPPVVDVESD